MVLPPLPETPLVSICTTAYNHERYIAEAIESVLAQDWPADRLEYLVIDDGSTDGTLAAIEPYRDRVRVIHQANQGVRAVMNRVVGEMTGDVICSVAGDDTCPPDRVRRLVEALQANPTAGLAYSDLEVIGSDGRLLHPSFMTLYGLTGHSGRIRGHLLARNFVSGGGIMLRNCLRDVFHPLPDHASFEDYWWAWSISGVADVVYVPHATYRYRTHGANLSLGATGERLAQSQRADIRFRRWMLATVEREEASPAQLVEGVATLLSVHSDLVAGGWDAVMVSDEDRSAASTARARAYGALEAGDVAVASIACARSAAADPTARDVALLAAELRARLRRRPDGHQLRGCVVIAEAVELASRPELLMAYARRFSAADDVTLVVAGPLELITVIGELLHQLGLDGATSADLLGITELTEALNVLPSAIARLGAPSPGALPCFDIDQIDDLYARTLRCSPLAAVA
jgi:hypothetical protein